MEFRSVWGSGDMVVGVLGVWWFWFHGHDRFSLVLVVDSLLGEVVVGGGGAAAEVSACLGFLGWWSGLSSFWAGPGPFGVELLLQIWAARPFV